MSLSWDHWCNGVCVNDIPHHGSFLNSYFTDALLHEIYDNGGWKLPAACHADVQTIILHILIYTDDNTPCLKWSATNGGTFNSFLQEYYKNESLVD